MSPFPSLDLRHLQLQKLTLFVSTSSFEAGASCWEALQVPGLQKPAPGHEESPGTSEVAVPPAGSIRDEVKDD